MNKRLEDNLFWVFVAFSALLGSIYNLITNETGKTVVVTLECITAIVIIYLLIKSIKRR